MKIESGLPATVPPPGKPFWKQILGWPSTRPGWWSVGLELGFWLFVGLFQLLIASGQRGGDTFFSNLPLSLTGLAALVSAIAGCVTALVAIGWKRERSILSVVALLWGLGVAFFALGEIFFPH